MPPRRIDPLRHVLWSSKSAPVGPDCALVLSAESRPPLALSYWDLWFALVADADFAGSWEGFVEHLRGQKARGVGRDLAERKLSHLRDLQQRLQHAGVALADMLAQADRSPGAVRRARQQVLERTPRESEWSDAMRFTPKQRHYAHALRGFWPFFPIVAPRLCRTPCGTVPHPQLVFEASVLWDSPQAGHVCGWRGSHAHARSVCACASNAAGLSRRW